MKPFTAYIGIFLVQLLVVTGCGHRPERKGETEQTLASGDSSIPDKEILEASQQQVEQRLENNIALIRARMRKLDEKLEHTQADLSRDALQRSQHLHEDLHRLKKDLEQTMDSLEEASNEAFRRSAEELNIHLEQAEDELAQINEELKEWYNKHTN